MIAPKLLTLLPAYIALYETGSFTLAGARLGVPRSTVSRTLAALEAELGEPLVVRTTRRVAMTTAGKDLYDRVAPLLAQLEVSLAERPEPRAEPSGLLRVTSMSDLGTAVLAEAAVRFTTRYPATRVELVLTPTVLDLTRDRIDLALRVTRGRLPDSRLVARHVGDVEFRMFAAPSYLARRDTPRTPAELSAHDWIGFGGVAPTVPKGTRPAPPSRIVCDDIFVLRELVRRGGGVSAMPSFLAADDVQAGTLVGVLPAHVVLRGRVHLVTPGRKQLASRVTAFRDLVVELLRQRPLAAP